MPLYHIIMLALIQGITEFLPISSSGHLGLYHCFTGNCNSWDAENLTMDVAVHVGTLIAVILYFWRDVVKMILGVFDVLRGRVKEQNSRLMLYVLVSSIPVILAGLALNIMEPDWLKTLYVIGWMTLIFGVVLWWADAKNPVTRSIEDMTFKDAVIIGLAQIIALIPGTSRSGITMTASRFLGYSRSESAHYSMLLAMIAISGAGALIGLDLIKDSNTALEIGSDVLIGIVLSFLSSFLTLHVMMRYLQKWSFSVFAGYRVVLGVVLLTLLYTGVIG